MKNLAYLSLGSNIAPEKNLKDAIKLLANYGSIQAVSTIWETMPVGFRDQPNYLNCAILLETSFSAQALRMGAIQKIENLLGRVRARNKNVPRTIDIDIMLFNHDILSIENRNIPDPEVHERAFVAIPLAEIAPDYIHPILKKPLSEIAANFNLETEGMISRPDIVFNK